jgi:hypothetical protein
MERIQKATSQPKRRQTIHSKSNKDTLTNYKDRRLGTKSNKERFTMATSKSDQLTSYSS